MIVTDTNIISYFYLHGEFTGLVEEAFKIEPTWAAPLIWRSEFRNVLALYMRKKIISLDDAVQIMQEAELLMKGSEYSVSSADVLYLTQRSDCSAYDCEFVVLARDLHIPLITMDRKILKNFPGVAVGLEQFCRSNPTPGY